MVTTQQAAELLGVSRPTVVKLIEDGKLEATKVTRHRRIKLEDVLRYQERQTIEQLDFLASTTSDAPALTESEYVSVRKMLANKRKESRIG
nr:helix-turn-helix domain-containing protein [Corynebacterium diphtheriae]